MAQAIPLSVLDDRLRVLDAEISRLTVERELLRSLRSQAVHMNSSSVVHSGPPKKTLTDQVREYVVANPGMMSTEIIDGLIHDGIETGGSDPRKTLSTTLGSLVQKRRLRRDETGRHFGLP